MTALVIKQPCACFHPEPQELSTVVFSLGYIRICVRGCHSFILGTCLCDLGFSKHKAQTFKYLAAKLPSHVSYVCYTKKLFSHRRRPSYLLSKNLAMDRKRSVFAFPHFILDDSKSDSVTRGNE